MLLLLENQDSFSHLLADSLWRMGQPCRVQPTLAAPSADLAWPAISGVVVGPGPGHPNEAAYLMAWLAVLPPTMPVLGVCLGMQALGLLHGARLGHAAAPCHGRVRPVVPAPDNTLYAGLQAGGNPLAAVRYHSLIVHSLPACLIAEAHSPMGELMAIRHATLPQWGVQYHPEAILTNHGPALLARWLSLAGLPACPKGAPLLGDSPPMRG